MISRIAVRTFGLGCICLALAACPPDDQRTDTLDPTTAGRELSAEAMAQVDSGNVAFRARDYEAALAHFTRVTEMAPDDATGWFGVYMAQEALGNADAADAALEQARSRAPGASLIRMPADTSGEGS